jgi:hypothetical protein
MRGRADPGPLGFVETTTLCERLGGPVGVDTIVRCFYDRVLGDPDGSVVPDIDDDAERWVRSDGGTLTRLLQSPPVVRPALPGLLLTRPDLVGRHLREALSSAGLATDLADEVVGAVEQATGCR